MIKKSLIGNLRDEKRLKLEVFQTRDFWKTIPLEQNANDVVLMYGCVKNQLAVVFFWQRNVRFLVFSIHNCDELILMYDGATVQIA